ncbi:hypothetical protein Tco_1144379 [Tanacetum coccineum]
MKSEDAGVKNDILTPGGERKKRIHRIGEIRKKNSDNICEGKIMAILKGYGYCKNHKKRAKNRAKTNTRRKEYTRAGIYQAKCKRSTRLQEVGIATLAIRVPLFNLRATIRDPMIG